MPGVIAPAGHPVYASVRGSNRTIPALIPVSSPPPLAPKARKSPIPQPRRRVGVWLFGAYGGLATTVVVGARAIARGLAAPHGLATASEAGRGVDFAAIDDLVFGGHEVRTSDYVASAREILAANGTLPRELIDTLAADLLQAEADWMKGQSLVQNMVPTGGQTVEAFMQARAERRAELARIEDAWFDNVKAGVQGVQAEQVQVEKNRRALQRAQSAVRGGGMFVPELTMSRAGRIDLDAAADALSPQAQAQAAAALAAWRSQLLQELAALQPALDAFTDRKSTRLNSSHSSVSRMPSSA